MEGRPKLIVTSLPPTDKGYDLAWKLLDEQLNDQERQKQALQPKLKNLAPAIGDLFSLRNVYEEMEALLRSLNTYKKVDEDEKLRKIVMSKYPMAVLDRISDTEVLALQLLRDRMKQLIRKREDIHYVLEDVAAALPPTPSINKEMSLAFFAQKKLHEQKKIDERNPKGNEVNLKKEPKCAFCKQPHYSSLCDKYTTLPQCIRTLPFGSCIICLRVHHNACRSSNRNYKCKSRKHNMAFCPDKFGYFAHNPKARTTLEDGTQAMKTTESKKEESPPSKQELNEKIKKNMNLVRTYRSSHITAMIPVFNPKTNKEVKVRTLFDNGCPDTFILQSRAEELNLDVHAETDVEVSTFGSRIAQDLKTKTVDLAIRSKTRTIHLFADTKPYIQGEVKVFDPNEFKLAHQEYSAYKFVETGSDEPIDLLIGNDFNCEILDYSSQLEVEPGLYLLHLAFGWIISGRMNSKHQQSSSVFLATMNALSTLWELDTLGIKDPNLTQDKEEELALQQFYDNVIYDVNEKRYKVTWPWRSYPPPIPTNYGLALGILQNI